MVRACITARRRRGYYLQQQVTLLEEQARLLEDALRCGRAMLRLQRKPTCKTRQASGVRAHRRRPTRGVAARADDATPGLYVHDPPPEHVDSPRVMCSPELLEDAMLDGDEVAGHTASQHGMGWLSTDDFLALAFGAGLQGDDVEWMHAFEKLSCEQKALLEDVVSCEVFVRLVMDGLVRQCHHTSKSLVEMLKVLTVSPAAVLNSAAPKDIPLCSPQGEACGTSSDSHFSKEPVDIREPPLQADKLMLKAIEACTAPEANAARDVRKSCQEDILEAKVVRTQFDDQGRPSKCLDYSTSLDESIVPVVFDPISEVNSQASTTTDWWDALQDVFAV